GELSESVTHAAKAMETWQALRQKEPANKSYQARLGQARVALTAFQLLNRQSSAAIETARGGLEAEPSRTMELKGMLSLAYIFEGQHEKARAILLENRSFQFPSMQTFAEAVLDDVHRFREKGLTTIDAKTIEQI